MSAAPPAGPGALSRRLRRAVSLLRAVLAPPRAPLRGVLGAPGGAALAGGPVALPAPGPDPGRAAAGPVGALDPGDASEPPIFEVTLQAHDALSGRGLRLLVAAVLGATAAFSAVLLAHGLWPIVPMLAADAAFLLALVLAHRERRAMVERIRIDRHGVRIHRFTRRGRPVAERRLPLYGITLVREWDPDHGLLALRLSLRGRAVELGRFLGPAERAAVADRLEAAMRQAGCAPWLQRVEHPPLLAP